MYVFLLLVIFSVSSGAQDAPAAPGTSTPATLVPVLLSMSPEERQQLEDILVKTNLTVKEMNDQVDDFFNGDSISPSLKSQYLAMKQAFAESLEVLNQEHDKAIQNASPECQKADAEVRAIAQDENLTMAEQNIRIFKIYQAQTPEVRKELNQYAIYKRTGESSSSSGF